MIIRGMKLIDLPGERAMTYRENSLSFGIDRRDLIAAGIAATLSAGMSGARAQAQQTQAQSVQTA